MMLVLVLAALSVTVTQSQHFFGPPAIGFGAGLISIHRSLPLATSIVSRRSSRSYSHQTFVQYTPKGVFGYRTATYTESDHFYTPNNMNYYQPNQYHYHSTPWQYRWGRSVREEGDEDDLSSNVTRSRRAAEPRLGAASSLRSLPANSISSMAENVSLAYQPDVWTNDMIFKDQDDCSKRMLCELNARRESGEQLTDNERIIADSYGGGGEVDINAESLEFDIAALLGKIGGMRRCEMSYRRCESSVAEMIKMIDIEVSELDTINSELADGNLGVRDIASRLESEAKSLGQVTLQELTRTTTTTTTPRPTPTTSKSGSYWWIDISDRQEGGNL